MYVNDVFLGSYDRGPLGPMGTTELFFGGSKPALQLRKYRILAGKVTKFPVQEERISVICDAIFAGAPAMVLHGIQTGSQLLAPANGRLVTARDALGPRILIFRTSDFDVFFVTSGDNVAPLSNNNEPLFVGTVMGIFKKAEGARLSIQLEKPASQWKRQLSFKVPFGGTTVLVPSNPASADSRANDSQEEERVTVMLPVELRAGRTISTDRSAFAGSTYEIPDDGVVIFCRRKDGRWLGINLLLSEEGKVIVLNESIKSYPFREEFVRPTDQAK